MPARIVVTGIILVLLAAFLVCAVEFFLPLSARSEMNICCRSTLLRMEAEGGLSNEAGFDLQTKLYAKGFINVVVNGTDSAKQGEELNLHVEADYIYSRLTSLLTRSDMTQRMIYDKTSISRKVVN